MKFATSLVVVALALPVSLGGCGGGDAAPDQAQDVKSLAHGRIAIYVGEDGQHYFRVVAANGEKLLRSEGYTSRGAAEKGVESAKKNGLSPKSYRLLESEDGQWFYDLVAKNGEIIGTSETYVSKSNAARGLATLQAVFADMAKAAPKTACFLERLASVPGGEAKAEVDMDHLDEGFGESDSVPAFEGSYNFSVQVDDGVVVVLFFENVFVLDEIGGQDCQLPPVERGTRFCETPFEVNQFLGTDEKEEKIVHAFDFGCRTD